MLQQIKIMKFQAEIYQLMTQTIIILLKQEIFYEDSSQTARMNAIKLDINHLKMQKGT
jgi:hypothetical protein